MVEERITDGYRIAELLASEVDGRRDGPLGRLAVANPDRTVEGTAAGERAYDVRRLAGDRDPRREPTPADAGELLARVFVHEEGATVALSVDHDGSESDGSERDGSSRTAVDAALEEAASAGLAVESGWRGDGSAVRVAYAAQAKRAADVLAAAVAGGE